MLGAARPSSRLLDALLVRQRALVEGLQLPQPLGAPRERLVALAQLLPPRLGLVLVLEQLQPHRLGLLLPRARRLLELGPLGHVAMPLLLAVELRRGELVLQHRHALAQRVDEMQPRCK